MVGTCTVSVSAIGRFPILGAPGACRRGGGRPCSGSGANLCNRRHRRSNSGTDQFSSLRCEAQSPAQHGIDLDRPATGSLPWRGIEALDTSRTKTLMTEDDDSAKIPYDSETNLFRSEMLGLNE